MQWDNSKNHGFSEANPDTLYLPLDPSEDAPTVEDQAKNPYSLYNEVKALIALRHQYKDLNADSLFEVIYAEKEQFPFVFRRGNLLIAVNPSLNKASASLKGEAFVKEGDDSKTHCETELIHSIGEVTLSGNSLLMQPQSFAVYKLI